MNQRMDKPDRRPGFRKGVLTLLLIVAVFAAWRFVFSSFSAARESRFAASPLPTGTLIVSPSPSAAPSPEATQITPPVPPIGKATVEAQAEETYQAALVYTPDSTVIARQDAWFQSVHATLTVAARETPTPGVFGDVPWSTPVGAGRVAEIIPPYYPRGANRFTNSWYEDSEGGHVRTYVHAGVKTDAQEQPTQQGLVVVQVLDLRVPPQTLPVVYQQEFLTPTASGSVTITGAVGEVLTLQSSGGTTFYFDVPARQFVPSGPLQSPLATPTPPEEP